MYISQKTEAPEIRCLNLICTWAANLSLSHFFWLYNLKKIGIGSYSFITFWEERMIGCNELPPISWCKISLASFLRMRGLRHSFHCDLQVFSLPLSFVKGSGIRKIRDFFFFFFFSVVFSLRASYQIFLLLNQLGGPQKLLGMVGQASVTQNFKWFYSWCRQMRAGLVIKTPASNTEFIKVKLSS